MSIGAQVTYLGNVLQQRLSTALVWLADAIAFLSRTVWPLVDLLIRIWIGRQALVLSVLISTNWAMAVSMATGSYPIPVAGLGSTALLSLLYWLAAVSLILGLATRVGAAVLLALAVASHIRVAALDLNLFWMALLAYYVLLGADRLSLDRLVSQGLKSSSLSQVGALITVLDGARPALTSIYLLALRVTPMLTLLLAGGHMSTAMMTTTAGIFEWLPVSFATLLFGEAGIALALLIGSGLATRATALLASALRSTWTARWGPADDLPLIGKPTCVRDAHPIDGLHVGARPKCEVRERPPLRRLSGLRGHQSWRRTIAIYEYPPFCNRIPPR